MQDKSYYKEIVTILGFVSKELHDYDFLNGDPSVLYLSPRILHLCADCLELLFPINNVSSIDVQPLDPNFESFIKKGNE